eukprot:7027241-Ditylum_brightwellii.AAC.1
MKILETKSTKVCGSGDSDSSNCSGNGGSGNKGSNTNLLPWRQSLLRYPDRKRYAVVAVIVVAASASINNNDNVSGGGYSGPNKQKLSRPTAMLFVLRCDTVLIILADIFPSNIFYHINYPPVE